VIIPAGEFTMGSPETELCRESDETQHTVILTQPLAVHITEVTQEQWVEVFGNNPSVVFGWDHPVEMISWFDAVIYCNTPLRVFENSQCVGFVRYARQCVGMVLGLVR